MPPPPAGCPGRFSSPAAPTYPGRGPQTPHPSIHPPPPARLRCPGRPLGAGSSARRPAIACSLTLGTCRHTARLRHLRALPPAGLAVRLRLPPAIRAAAQLPAAPPPRAAAAPSPPLPAPPLPSPPLPSVPALGFAPQAAPPPTRGSLSSRKPRSLRQLNPSPAAPPRRPGPRAGAGPLAARRVGERRSGRVGRGGEIKARAHSPHLRRPSAPRLAWCWAEEAGRGRKQTAVGKGRPAQPPARVPVFETNRSHGANPARSRASSCGQQGAQADGDQRRGGRGSL